MIRALPFILTGAAAACGEAPMPTADQANNASGDIATTAPANVATNQPTPPFAETPGAHPYPAPEPAPIPAKFRGTWAANRGACSDLSHHSRLTISGRTVRFTDFVIFGDSVTLPADNQFAIKGKVEGTDHPAEAHYSLDATGNRLIDEAGGGAIRVRCG